MIKNSFGLLHFNQCRKLIVLACFLLFGCTMHTLWTDNAESRDVLSIDCSGSDSQWSRCFAKADELCGRGNFDVLGKLGNGVRSIDAETPGPGPYALARTLVVECMEVEDRREY